MGEPIGLRPSRKREPPTDEDVVLPGESQHAKRGAQEITEKEMHRLPSNGSPRDYNNSPCWIHMPISMQPFFQVYKNMAFFCDEWTHRYLQFDIFLISLLIEL